MAKSLDTLLNQLGEFQSQLHVKASRSKWEISAYHMKTSQYSHLKCMPLAVKLKFHNYVHRNQ